MMSRHETPQPSRRVEADRPEAARADAAGVRRRRDAGEVGGPEQPDTEAGWLTQGTDAYHRVTAEVAALGGFTRVTIVRNSYANASVCVECVKESVVWGQCGDFPSRKTSAGYFCSVECLRVWAIKQGLTRDVPKT
jgi:hypothetical protein